MALSDNQIEQMKLKRKKILDQAIALFAAQGYKGTTIKNISQAAGVSFGTVFTYFENKEDLFHAAATEPLQAYANAALSFDPNAANALEEIKSMVTSHINLFANLGTFLKLVVYVVGYYQQFQKTFDELDTFHETLKEKIARLIENGQQQGQLHTQHPVHVAQAYTSLLIGFRLNLVDTADSQIWEAFVPIATQLFGPKVQ